MAKATTGASRKADNVNLTQMTNRDNQVTRRAVGINHHHRRAANLAADGDLEQ